MIIKNLEQTRTNLINSFKNLTDEQFNKKPSADRWSVAQVVQHLYTTEVSMADLILVAIETKSKSEPVEDKDFSFVTDRTKKVKAPKEPPSDFFTKKEMIALLEKSRSEHLQAVFNKTHVNLLAEKSLDHPAFGKTNLKNLIEFIYLHEQRHIEQIEEIKNELFA